MFKKVLLGCGVLFILAIVLCAGGLFWAQRSGSERQDRFFVAVSSGDPQEVLALLHPSLREQVDPPVLAAWMNAVRDKLGAYQGLSKTSFTTNWTLTGEGLRIESKGTVDFEKGTAESKLVFLDGQLIEYTITSDALKDWFHGLAETDLYRQRGKEFLTHVLGNEPQAAFAMMNPELQKIMPMAKLEEMIAKNASAGKLESIDYRSEDRQPGAGRDLKIFYNTRTEKAKQVSSVEFKFIGLKGSILGFDLNDREGADADAGKRP